MSVNASFNNPCTQDSAPITALNIDRLIEAAKQARDAFRAYATHHLAKSDPEKAQRNTDLADALDCALCPFDGAVQEVDPWKETVRDLYDEMLRVGCTHVKTSLIIKFIEERHDDFFVAGYLDDAP